MRLIGLAVVLAATLTIAPLTAGAQQLGKAYRIGWLAYSWTEGAERTSPEFVQELKKHIQDFVFEFRGTRDAELLPGLARQLVQLRVDVTVANGTVAAQAARSVTQSVPIVFLISADPIGTGLVTSLARPGGNVTGPSAMSTDFATKRLELFKEAVPNVSRIGVLSSYDTAGHLAQWNGIEAAAPQARLQLRRITARGAADFEGAFAAVLEGEDRRAFDYQRSAARRRPEPPRRAGAPESGGHHVRRVAIR